MDENLNPYDPDSRPPQAVPPKPGRRFHRAALTGGVAVGLALGGAGLAYAASSAGSTATPAAASSSTTQPSNANPHPDKPFDGPRGRLGQRFGFGGRVVHGTFTVHSGSGYKTVEMQIGQVTEVSASSITLKSSDGYTHTYDVLSSTVVDSQAGGISSVSKSDQVDLMATSQAGKETAVNIVDRTKVGASRKGFGFGPPAGVPAPSSGSQGSSTSYSNGWPAPPEAPFGGQVQ